MEIIVSVFAALVAGSCLLAVVKSNFKDRKKATEQIIEENDS